MKTQLDPQSILGAVEEQLGHFHLDCERSAEYPAVTYEYELDGVNWETYAFVTDDAPALRIVAISPLVIRPKQRPQMRLLVEGINSRISHGCLFFCGENSDHLAIRFTVPLLASTDPKEAARFGISVCGNAFTHLGAPLAAAALAPINTSAFFKAFDAAADTSNADDEPPKRWGSASGRIGLN
jgi:hypothetical protein